MISWPQIVKYLCQRNEQERAEIASERVGLVLATKNYHEAYNKLLDLIKKALPNRICFYDLRDPVYSTLCRRQEEPRVEVRVSISIGEARIFSGGKVEMVEAVGEMVKREVIKEIMSAPDYSPYTLKRM